ncbi:EamA family transporter [Vibrio hepatarius]|uniref:EamA family transporter n=1 Tax=Vibrio hepatarius TaxID=171383 RepID=UPI00142D24F2|nr:EamA family transporter [Vibrio hepatarius]
MINLQEFIFCLCSVSLSSLSQIAFKLNTQLGNGEKIKYLLLGISLMVGSMLFVLLALRTMNLSILVMFAPLSFVLVPVLSVFFFKEKINTQFWIGTFMIITGITVSLVNPI